MPKAFSEHEKETLRAQLREKGKKLFEKQGLRKTSVDELSEAVGISKGAFYLFYESKEELFLEILEDLETELRTRIFDFSINPKEGGRELLATLLKSSLLAWDQYPLLKNFGKAEFEYLVRKIPPERIQAHANRDNKFINDFIKKIKSEGITVQASPRVISNLMIILLLVSLHREDFGERGYMETMKVLADLVAGYIVGG